MLLDWLVFTSQPSNQNTINISTQIEHFEEAILKNFHRKFYTPSQIKDEMVHTKLVLAIIFKWLKYDILNLKLK